MKRKILGVAMVLMLAISFVFAAPTRSYDEVLKTELSAEIEKEVSKNNGFQSLAIDKTFDITKVEFVGEHTVYSSIDTKEDDFVFENRYVTAAVYNGDEIADIYYRIKNEEVLDVKVVLDKTGVDKDVILTLAKNQLPTITNKNEISLYIPNDDTVIAFTENTYKMFSVKDENGRYADYVSKEADGTLTIEREEFFNLHSQRKISNKVNTVFVEATVSLQVILIVLFAILAILAFLSYILINKDKINNVPEKKEAKKVATKKVAAKPAKKTTKK